MSREVVFDPEARQEFDDAYDWYEERREGAGERFADLVQDLVDRLALTPFVHAVFTGQVRKASVPRYPYAIYYLADDNTFRVIAVFHTRRNPAVLFQRLPNESTGDDSD